MLLKKILKGKNLNTGPQHYVMTKKFLVGKSLRVFGIKYCESSNKNTTDYKLVIQDLEAYLFYLKELKLQKRYLRWGLFKPDTPIYVI